MKNTLKFVVGSFVLFTCMMVFAGCDNDDDDMAMIVRDVDGNIYNTTEIGTQVWLASELKTTRFCDGTTIPLVTEDSEWDNTDQPAFCWYNNDENLFDFALYNWYAVESGCLCPEGWHVPSAAEWDVLEEFLGGREVAGGHMKRPEAWKTANHIGSDNYGFMGMPTRRRATGTGFLPNDAEEGGWWTSTLKNTQRARTSLN